ncbi:hypothetical protein IQ229_07815 [Nostoc cf. edaphicum LEGE 07299]|uniref:Transposase n=1 Tax=Nostoc cf. edaphicum LEGE 07299 TaxID=2777974 RepID=A0ABR9TWY0_9NOSO|nr:hypothetical protein [Nostoc edaphicum]MBE9104849.1 hypothetical protein [Nostoc cf. edaphicum LEGE 07299]
MSVAQFFGFIIVQVGEHSRAGFRLKRIAKDGTKGSIYFWKKHRAIGNRGYTNEVRLRGLSETRAGGFSLYSPRLLV